MDVPKWCHQLNSLEEYGHTWSDAHRERSICFMLEYAWYYAFIPNIIAPNGTVILDF